MKQDPKAAAERRRKVEAIADMLRKNPRLSSREVDLMLRAKGVDLNRTQITYYTNLATTLLTREQIFGTTFAAKMFRRKRGE